MSRLHTERLTYSGRGPIDLDVGPGECLAVTGPSGSGKTLLLRALADLDLHEGLVFLDGVECAAIPAPEWRRQVGLLPAESQWWFDTVGDHFAGADLPWLGRMGFGTEVMGWSVARLSTGERQRLALLRLLAHRPKALLLDEPTANLDADNQARVEALVAEFRAQTGAPVVWVTHDAAQRRRVATRQMRIADGRLALEEQR